MADKKLKEHIVQRENAVFRLKEIKAVADEAITNNKVHGSFKIRYRHVASIVNEFNNHHATVLNILSSTKDPDMEEQHNARKAFDNDFYEIEETYSALFDDKKNKAQVATPTHVKLPKLELKKFNGSINNWKTFIDLFNSMIHNNSSLSNVEKFTYLLNSLEGPPLSIVQCNPLTDGNYLIAYNALINRYENSRLISVSHWREIEKIKKLTNERDVKSLQHLLDTFTEHLSALEHSGHPVKQWDFVLFYMLFDRLDPSTATRFELECGQTLDDFNNKNKHFEILVNFLKRQCVALDTISNSSPSKSPEKEKSGNKFLQKRTFLVNSESLCSVCNKKGHLIYSCPEFLKKNSEDKFNFIKANKWCTNCLGTKHTSFKCSSRVRCAKCSKAHHTLLHRNQSQLPPPSNNNVPSDNPSTSKKCDVGTQSVALANLKPKNNKREDTVLLATAQIRVLDSRGTYQSARVLLDSASQVNFISTKYCNRLGLNKRPLSLSVKGLGDTTSNISQEVTCTFVPERGMQPQITLDFAIIPQICGNMPPSDLPKNNFSKFCNLELADNNFNISSPVDMLLGCDAFGFLFKGNNISTSIEEPVAFDTHLGWIIMGRVPMAPLLSSKNTLCSVISPSLDETVKKFWLLEQVPQVISLSSDDIVAEKIFSETLSRNPDGRYVVQLPFKDSYLPEFKNSRDIALRRFYSLERRLLANSELHEEYNKFMRDYLESGHMELATHPPNPQLPYYIPHHCVVRPESSTTKLRVVFDASAKAANNLSLNDTLLVGPKLQQDIFSLLLRFRTYSVVFTADIKQMFRQINMSEYHRDFQRIVWRFSKSEPIQDYRLNTVTYGVSSSPFQAIRTILQLARDHQSQFPRAAKVLEKEIYVDDILSGAADVESALKLQKEIIELFARGGFELRKWASNHPLLLSHLDNSLSQLDPLSLDKESDSTIKILGLQWNPSTDSFTYKIDSKCTECTKRNVLSDLARIFDPLGFLTPCTVFIKLLIQELWSSGLDWDEAAPNSINERWSSFKDGLPSLSFLALPRKVIPGDMKFCELHGFADSSEQAYAAVVYLRVILNRNEVQTFFLCAKSRVAPLKRISIPRLELCAAVLLSDLLSSVSKNYKDVLNITSICAWTDSTVALAWIRSSPHKWATFVSNRVTYIQENLAPHQWSHVTSEENPSDCATRPVLPQELARLKLWWAGPTFLTSHCQPWHSEPFKLDEDITLEKRKIALTVTSSPQNIWEDLIERFSSLSKINRIYAYVLRFISALKDSKSVPKGPLSLGELDNALLSLIKQIQAVSFSNVIVVLSKGTNSNLKLLPKYLRKLSPFLDQSGVLRVGGRLNHSALSYESKHPCLLPSDHRLTRLIIEYIHKKYLHPGLQTTQYLLSQRYWIPSFKTTVKKVLSSCIRCFKCNPTSHVPLMGDLPAMRVNQIKCFTRCGVDFGGPFFVTMGNLRGAKTYKAYICLFVCLATKALHLELATELSSECFLAALRRFLSRRGSVTDIYSDCGTNFVGASKQLVQNMRNACVKEGIQWHFNPPGAPNFGGIWEAGIKSVKKHIARVVGTQTLTYEEFSTVLISIEAVLNSRPLCSLSTDPNDLNVLTPGHFLNLQPLNSFIEPDLAEIKLGRLSRWQLLQRMHQDFWKRWHAEYLHTLNQRAKWYDPSVDIKIDTLVLLKDELSPPLTWHLGRVVELHPGADGVTRVVTVKTQKGVFKRLVSKVCPLPDF